MVWRTVWGLLDIYLFPNNPTLSYIVAGSIGLLVLWLDDFRLFELDPHPMNQSNSNKRNP